MLAVGAALGRRRIAAPKGERAPVALTLTVGAIALLLLLPVAGVVLNASSYGWDQAGTLLSRPLVPTLLTNTVSLTLATALSCAALGIAAAWCIERTDIPFRRVLRVLLVLPLAIPEFVAGYSWVSLMPSVQGFSGAWLVMTFSLYPWVYLPVAAALRRSDPALDDVARSCGVGPVRRFVRVTLPEVRTAALGGMLVVALYLLAEYGTFAVLRYRTFATAIYNEYKLSFEPAAASVDTLVLCVMAVLLLTAEQSLGRRPGRTGEGAARPAQRVRLGRGTPVAVGGLLVVVALALGVPVGSITYWMLRGGSTTLPPASIVATTLQSLALGAGAAVVATALAVPVAVLSLRHPGRGTALLERSTYLVRALPGVAVALTFVGVVVRHLQPLYQTTSLLELAYVVLFFPLALVAVRGAVAVVPASLEETARSLGEGWWGALRRVTLPLVLPGLGAAVALVLLSATTELTATLLLRPTGTETLATQFWVYTTGLAYGAAAPYAAIMVAMSVPPVLLLTRAGRDRRDAP